MVCPFCGSVNTSVRNSRHTNRRGQVWRRRQCEKCERLFTTRETVDVGFLEVLKRSDNRESYSPAKLLRSLLLATDHLAKPDTALHLSQTIEHQLLLSLPQTSTVISSEDIANTALTALKRFDTRSYVKYLSYQTKMLDAADLRKMLVKKPTT